ncbi:flagellar hook-length control protein FliK [Blastomonas fulva]|jgi:flagellar hook-length control protein FliK|uniref:flagellar hook-length control protein FliK n=1 Tax=Blastomonas fulva TaxID=1550728 RepID=UPI0025A31EBA|nr:flagellar hook-length control protein FliK [Blastomonas fulva]MDM7927750.1 flagellar hook-length control protein FliK [Blastomonas fulva]MDM7967853.1 flagellar hook-length control protein FliK [Blastomonas fulva]
MSQDMMQALSGSSLMSLSVGTLPAVKSGMMLDANPFASQLAQMTGPDAAMGDTGAAGAAVAGAGDSGFALALALLPAPVAVAQAVPLAEAPEIPALPEDASPTAIIEAVLGGVMKPAAAPVAASAPIAAEAPVTQAAAAVLAPQTPALRQITPQALPEAVAAEDIAADPHTARPRRTARLDEPVAGAADAVPLAAPAIEAVVPAPVRPEASAPDTGSVPFAISARPAPVTGSVPAAKAADTVTDAAPQGVAPRAPLMAGDDIVQTQAQPVTQPQALAQTQAVQLPAEAPQTVAASSLQSDAVQSGAVGSNAETTAPAPTAQAQPGRGVTAERASAPVAIPASPAKTEAPKVAPEQAPVTDAAATAEIILPGQIPLQPQRSTATPASRTAVSAAGQRAIQAAAQAARPAQALSALFDLADPSAHPVSAASMLDAVGAKTAEAVPPSWAAALNAVVAPAIANTVQGLTAPVATGAAQAAPLETLAFDAGFVGNVETQIARVVGGGQMVRMQISPEHLGRIDIEMLAGPERDHVRITTEHDAVRDTLVQSQVRLEQDLRANNQRSADVTVELRQQSPGAQGGSAQQQRGQSGQEAGSAREALARQTTADPQAETSPAQRRARGNVRYA